MQDNKFKIVHSNGPYTVFELRNGNWKFRHHFDTLDGAEWYIREQAEPEVFVRYYDKYGKSTDFLY